MLRHGFFFSVESYTGKHNMLNYMTQIVSHPSLNIDAEIKRDENKKVYGGVSQVL